MLPRVESGPSENDKEAVLNSSQTLTKAKINLQEVDEEAHLNVVNELLYPVRDSYGEHFSDVLAKKSQNRIDSFKIFEDKRKQSVSKDQRSAQNLQLPPKINSLPLNKHTSTTVHRQKVDMTREFYNGSTSEIRENDSKRKDLDKQSQNKTDQESTKLELS